LVVGAHEFVKGGAVPGLRGPDQRRLVYVSTFRTSGSAPLVHHLLGRVLEGNVTVAVRPLWNREREGADLSQLKLDALLGGIHADYPEGSDLTGARGVRAGFGAAARLPFLREHRRERGNIGF